MARNAYIIAGLVVTATLCAGQGVGSVKVMVWDDHDLPVAGAKVTAFPDTRCALAFSPPWCLTDSTGSCTLHLSYGGECGGKHSIFASKEEADDYPERYMGFYGATDPTLKYVRVELSTDHPTDAVTVHLGKRAGILTGTVKDAVTGGPLNADAKICWVSNPVYCIQGSGLTNAKFRILIPSDTPITMVVSLNGYENWTYSLGKGAMKNAILLGPGEEMRLDIRLRPKE